MWLCTLWFLWSSSFPLWEYSCEAVHEGAAAFFSKSEFVKYSFLFVVANIVYFSVEYCTVSTIWLIFWLFYSSQIIFRTVTFTHKWEHFWRVKVILERWFSHLLLIALKWATKRISHTDMPALTISTSLALGICWLSIILTFTSFSLGWPCLCEVHALQCAWQHASNE